MATTHKLHGLASRDTLALVALVVMVGGSYFPALSGGIIFDDHIFTDSQVIRETSGLWNIWFSPGDIKGESHYWPLVYTSFWLEYQLWGFSPFATHLVNVALHLLNSVLVWRLLLRLGVPWAWVAAAVFAVHPVHVESVAWMIERKDVLSGLFYLTAALTWLRFVDTRGWGSRVLSLVLYVAAMLSKTVTVTLPAALLIRDWWKQGRVTAADLLRLAPFFVAGLCVTLGDLFIYYGTRGSLSLDYSLLDRVLIAARALWFYLGKLLWPVDLTIFYPLWDVRADDPVSWVFPIVTLALAAVLWLGRHRLGRGPLAGALFFAVTLSPVLGFIDYGHMQNSLVADRYQYLAAAGVMAVGAAACAGGVMMLPGWWRMGVKGLVAVMLVVLGILTWRQAGVYKDEITFFSHVVSVNPRQPLAHRRLAGKLVQAGRLQEALAAGRFAVEQLPDFPEAHFALGQAFLGLGRFDDAEKSFRRALEFNAGNKYVLHSMGESMRLRKRFEKALEWYGAALRSDPGFAPAHLRMGYALAELRRFDEAAASLKKAVSLRLDLNRVGTTHVLLGMVLQELSRTDEAAHHYERALSFNGRDISALGRLAAVRMGQSRFEEALDLYHAIIEIDSSKAKAHSNLGTALYRLGRYDEALRSFEHALSLDDTLIYARIGIRQVREALQRRGR